MEEMHIYDIDFLYGCSQPTIVLLHEDVHGRHVKTHEISLKDRDLVKVCYLGSVLTCFSYDRNCKNIYRKLLHLSF